MKQYLILLAVVALAIPAGCDRAGVEDETEFDPSSDGLGFRFSGDSIPISLGADQTALATAERERLGAGMAPVDKPKASPFDKTGLKPEPGTGGAGTGGTEKDKTGTETATGGTETATGGTKTGTGAGGTETGKTGTGTGTTGTSAIDDILKKQP